MDISSGRSVGADFGYETPDIAVYINYFVIVVVELVVNSDWEVGQVALILGPPLKARAVVGSSE